jgi:uncharacterized protein (DUF305 family)
MVIEQAAWISAAVLLVSGAASPPIQNPGAPGQDSQEITAEQSVEMSRSTHTAADTRFMQHMIVHHAQAVEMNALIEGRTDTAALQALGARIAQTQESEMAFMERWLAERGEETADPHLHAGHATHAGHDLHAGHGGHQDHGAAMDPGDVPLMPGMLSPNQMAALAAAQGETFDRLFLEGMIHHHRGAIAMVEGLLAEPGNGEDPQLSEFLTHVTADQAAEILRMQTMLSALDAADHQTTEPQQP